MDGKLAISPIAETATGVLRGDANFDGDVNDEDIDAFIIALFGGNAYEQTYNASPLWRCDTDNNGLIDFDDAPGFVRLLSPEPPTQLTRVFERSTDTPVGLSSGSTEVLGTPLLSANGRYVLKRHESTNYDLMVVDSLQIYDSYSDTDLIVKIPDALNFFTHIRYTQVDIAANAGYIAFTAMRIPDDFPTNHQTYEVVVRYNLDNGAVDVINDLSFSEQPSISADGQRIVFVGPNNTMYLKDFRNDSLSMISQVENPTFYGSPVISGNGRYAVAPVTSSKVLPDGTIVSPSNISSSVSFALFDLETMQKIRMLIDYGSSERTYYNPSLSADGRFAFFAKRVSSLGSQWNMVVYDRFADEEKIVATAPSFRVIDRLSISGDGTFVSFWDTIINQSTGESYEFNASSQLDFTAELASLSQDGCFVGLRTFTEDAYIFRNPLKSCTKPKIAGDYNRNDQIDIGDFDVLSGSWGMTVTPYSNGDGNGDGQVNFADFSLWVNNMFASSYSSQKG